MGGVVFVFVREDASEAETLAEAFDDAGFSITGSGLSDDALSVIVWSRHAVRSVAFRDAAERALRAGRAVVASLSATPARESVFGAAVVDLTAWHGQDGGDLDELFEIADAISRPAASNIVALPSRPAFEDAEFVELTPIGGGESERIKRARRSWEASIPTEMLRPVREERPPAPAQKQGATTPRRDFRRLRSDRHHPRAFAALAFALVALAGSGVIAVGLTSQPESRAQVSIERPNVAATEAVSLASAAEGASGLDNVVIEEPLSLFEPAPQIGRAGLEPPSARPVRRAARAVRTDRAAYRPPSPIPDDIMADLQRDEAG